MTLVPDFLLQILLLDRGQRGIDDEQAGALLLGELGDLLDLALAEQGRGPDGADAECRAATTSMPIASASPSASSIRASAERRDALARQFGDRDDRTLAARHFDCAIAVELFRTPSSSPLAA